MRILHVIDHIGAGGPARSLLTFAKHTKSIRPDIEHRILSLRQDGYPPLFFSARRMGLDVVRSPHRAVVNELVDSSDVVLLHFWNTPLFWEFFSAECPARYVVWSKVMGTAPPQMLNRHMLKGAASVVLTADPGWPELDHERVRIVPGIADFGRVESVRSERHAGFNVDYIGATNCGKIHPGFARMMSRVEVPGIGIRICSGQTDPHLIQAIKASGKSERFRCLGFVEDISTVLKTSDVFGYPLSENTYATSDKSLQEAMYAGVPPVIFPHGGPARFVQNGKTGLVANSEDEFVHAIEYLYRNPDKRAELGQNAKDYARVAFAPSVHAADLLKAVTTAVEMPARKIMPGLADTSHAVLFLISQGWQTPEAVSAVEQWQDGSGSELDAWVTSLPLQAFQVEGGIVHWRNHARGDPALRWWSALWLFKLGRYGEADKELEAAISNGAPLERCLQLRSAIRIVSNPALEKRDDGARSSTNLLLTKLGLSQAPHNGFEA